MHLAKLLTASLTLMVSIAVAGCTQVKVTPGSGQSQTGTATNTGNATATNTSTGANQQASASNPLSGDWQFGFQFNNSTLHSTVHLDQQGNNFSGTGKDDESGMQFTIEQGELSNGQVTFYKKYGSTKAPDIQYTGTMEMSNDANYQGPYLHGEYTTRKGDKFISNIWEAELSKGMAGGQQQQQQASPPPPDDSTNPMIDKTPDLSGKWKVGYEYNFDTVHSTMFLEQMGDRITGHGVDQYNVKDKDGVTKKYEKFVIDKGWYSFPKLTLIRRWPASSETTPAKGKHGKGKGKTVTKPERTMTFRADVKVVRDKDYMGPYLSGKTSGGGAWEAEMQLYKP